jgi:hypothetical protein
LVHPLGSYVRLARNLPGTATTSETTVS